MIEEAEKTIDVPLENVWELFKDLENITSLFPGLEIIEKIDDNELLVSGESLPFLDLLEEVNEGEMETVEVNDSERYTRTIIKGESFEIEIFLQCEEKEENKTKIYLKIEGELKEKEGETPSVRINEILQNLEENIKEYMRKHWKEKFEKKTEELKSFVYTVSHDLRTPLISLEGFADILEEDYEEELGEDGKHYLERITANVHKIDNFLDDLLQLSRIGRKEPEKEEVNLNEIVQEVLDDLREKLEEKEIELTIENDLPTFYFERKRMYQLFSNLISNACNFMGDQENPRIEIGGKEEDGNWLLWVEDNGIGIEDDQKEKIFEVFHKESRVEEEGIGVGLTITKRIVETHDGEIWVESEKDEGSTFYMKFPKAAVEESENE